MIVFGSEKDFERFTDLVEYLSKNEDRKENVEQIKQEMRNGTFSAKIALELALKYC